VAIASHYLGDANEAARRSERALARLPAGETSWNAMAVVSLFARARSDALLAAVRGSKTWPPQWLSDLDAAYTVLAAHPLGTEAHVAAHFELLRELGVPERAKVALQAGLKRFPESWVLHECLRRHALAEEGIEGLGRVYGQWLREASRPSTLAWFAGYADLVTAEYYRRAGNPEAAERAYGQALARYEEARRDEPSCAASADHYCAMALAGRARIAFEHGELLRALEFLEAAIARKPEAAAQPDGLNLSAVDTAKLLLSRLRLERDGALTQRLEAALARLEPGQLELPAYEQVPDAPR
jgi:tetratricopeptide (TPR) repeat protein